MPSKVSPASLVRSRWAAAGLVLALGTFLSLSWVGAASAQAAGSSKLSLVKSAEQGGTAIDAGTDLVRGDTFTYVITATSQAASAIHDLVITDDLPNSVTPAGPVSVTTGGSTTTQPGADVVIVAVDTLAAGGTVTIRIPVELTAQYPECMKLNNKATAAFTYSSANTPGTATSNKVTLSMGCGSSPTPTPTDSSPSPTDTGSPSPTDTGSPSPTDTGSPSPTDTGSPSPTDTGSPSPTPTDSTGASALTIVKANDPTGIVKFGATITYTLTVSVPSTATDPQTGVVVTDTIPGHDPAHPTSGVTTYVTGSAGCVGSTPPGGTCDVTETTASGVVTDLTWALGTIQPGQSRQVTFAVTADKQDAVVAGSETVDFINVAAVESDTTDRTSSNVVTNTAVITGVAGEELTDDGTGELPHTGPLYPMSGLGAAGLLMIVLGALLLHRLAPATYQPRHANRG